MKKLILFNLLVIGLATGLISGVAHADRPYVSEKPATVANGTIQLESGVTYYRGGDDKNLSLGEVVASAGITKNADIQIGTNYNILHLNGNRSSGLSDGSVALKVRVNPHFAVQVGTSLPFGSDAFTSNSYDPFVKAIVGTNLSKNLYVFGNLGYQYNREKGIENNILGSLALEQTLDAKSKAFVEVYGISDNHVNNRQGSVAAGLIHRVNDHFQFDVRVGRSLNNIGEPNYFGGVGITLNN